MCASPIRIRRYTGVSHGAALPRPGLVVCRMPGSPAGQAHLLEKLHAPPARAGRDFAAGPRDATTRVVGTLRPGEPRRAHRGILCDSTRMFGAIKHVFLLHMRLHRYGPSFLVYRSANARFRCCWLIFASRRAIGRRPRSSARMKPCVASRSSSPQAGKIPHTPVSRPRSSGPRCMYAGFPKSLYVCLRVVRWV